MQRNEITKKKHQHRHAHQQISKLNTQNKQTKTTNRQTIKLTRNKYLKEHTSQKKLKAMRQQINTSNTTHD